MTRFGKWFTGALALAITLFVVGLMMPSRPHANKASDVRHEPDFPVVIGADTSGDYRHGPFANAIRVRSGLVVPVVGVRPAALVDTFSERRGEGGARGHGALDIMAPRGTPVLAAAGGTIEKLFYSELGGHTIYIRSPNRRNIYYYAHLHSYAPGIREGMVVGAGDAIGTVGSTGDADPAAPHLHFEIKRMAPGQPWHEGTGINPYPLLAGKPALAGGRAGG